MVFRWKEVKFSQNGIDQFFWPIASTSPYYVRVKIRRKTTFLSKFHKNAVTRVFWHVEFISALKTELNPMVFEKKCKKIK